MATLQYEQKKTSNKILEYENIIGSKQSMDDYIEELNKDLTTGINKYNRIIEANNTRNQIIQKWLDTIHNEYRYLSDVISIDEDTYTERRIPGGRQTIIDLKKEMATRIENNQKFANAISNMKQQYVQIHYSDAEFDPDIQIANSVADRVANRVAKRHHPKCNVSNIYSRSSCNCMQSLYVQLEAAKKMFQKFSDDIAQVERSIEKLEKIVNDS